MDEEPEIVHVFGSDDNLKVLGELLANETGRKILFNLMNTDMYTNEIAVKLDIRVSLVIHHLEKMQQLGLLEITEKKLVRKGKNHRFFKVNPNFFISVNQTKKEIEETGLLKRIFKDTVKFTSIVISGFFAFMVTSNLHHNAERGWGVDNSLIGDEILLPIVVSLLVIVIGLIIERIYFQFKK